MEICNRCKINKAEIKCDKCNKKYCKLCDYYLHVINKDIHNNKNNKSKDIDNISTLKTGKIKDIKKSNNNIIPYENKNVNNKIINTNNNKIINNTILSQNINNNNKYKYKYKENKNNINNKIEPNEENNFIHGSITENRFSSGYHIVVYVASTAVYNDSFRTGRMIDRLCSCFHSGICCRE